MNRSFSPAFIYGPAQTVQPSAVFNKTKFQAPDFQKRKKSGKIITMTTCYDASSAQHVEASPIDIALVGDSAANVIQGKSSTTGMTMEEMLLYSETVARQCSYTFVVGDLPFGAYTTETQGVSNAVRLVKEAGVDAVKLEGGSRMANVIRSIRNCGITVVGHCGVTPQTVAEKGGFKVSTALRILSALIL